jgi:alkylation response protein AidB-like acyl-CoA dehydrogenase
VSAASTGGPAGREGTGGTVGSTGPADIGPEFAERCRRFLDEHAPRSTARTREWGIGPDTVPIFDSPTREVEEVELAAARRWLAALWDAGLGWLDGPPEYGGAGLSTGHRELFGTLAAEYATPKLNTVFISLNIVAPGLLACGSAELKKDLLPRLYRGDLIACQLFSEPAAGSDLSAVATRATPVPGGWEITGQKVWTSGGHYSDLGLLLTRTSDNPVQHRRLTMFVVDMHDPAIEVRPLREMSGGAHFNEVFIDQLRVLDDQRVGEVDGGWRVAMATLSGERKAVGDSDDMPNWEVVQRLVELARHRRGGMPLDGAARDAVMRCYALGHALELTTARLVEAHSAGAPAGPEMSVLKLLRNRLLRQSTDAAATLLGPSMVADTGEWGTYAWGRAAVLAPGLRIGGGTDEIQRNILAERVLGLPKEPRPS